MGEGKEDYVKVYPCVQQDFLKKYEFRVVLHYWALFHHGGLDQFYLKSHYRTDVIVW